MNDIARNSLCPCGSGRKYKQCCLRKVQEPATEELRLARRWHDISNRVFEDVLAWSNRRFGKRRFTQPMLDLFSEEDLAGPVASFASPWLVFHHPIEGKTPAEHYFAALGDKLPSEERTALATQHMAWLSVWEVTAIKPGEGVELRDVLTHETRFAHDAGASRSVTQWCLLLGYVVDHPGVSVLDGVHPAPLAPDEAESLLTDARRRLRVRTRPAPVERLRDPEHSMLLIMDWQLALMQREHRARQPMQLRNTDGDPILFTVDHFDIEPGARAAIARDLKSMPLVSVREEPDGILGFTCSKPGNALHRSWDNTVVGNLELGDCRLRAETNSIARADALRAQLVATLGDRIRHQMRDHRDANAMLEQARRAPRSVPGENSTRAPELQAAMREFMEQHWRDWLDEPVPALDGLTPRESAARAPMRRRLVTLLKQFTTMEARKPEAERYDMGKLWEALAIDPRSGEHVQRAAPSAPEVERVE